MRIKDDKARLSHKLGLRRALVARGDDGADRVLEVLFWSRARASGDAEVVPLGRSAERARSPRRPRGPRRDPK